jgi:hypothetical protein
MHGMAHGMFKEAEGKHGMPSRFICLRGFTFCSYFSDTQFDFTFSV